MRSFLKANLILVFIVFLAGCGTKHAPVIIELSINPQVIHRGQHAQVECIATDEDNDLIRYEFTATGGTITSLGSNEAIFTAYASGSYIIQCKAIDETGLYDKKTEIVWVR